MRRIKEDYKLPVGRISAGDVDRVEASTTAEKTHRQTILMPNAIIDVLRQVAKDEDRSLQSIFRESLDLFLGERGYVEWNELVAAASLAEKRKARNG